jgi:hypothetical protein
MTFLHIVIYFAQDYARVKELPLINKMLEDVVSVSCALFIVCKFARSCTETSLESSSSTTKMKTVSFYELFVYYLIYECMFYLIYFMIVFFALVIGVQVSWKQYGDIHLELLRSQPVYT